jgi:hypothetical protein
MAQRFAALSILRTLDRLQMMRRLGLPLRGRTTVADLRADSRRRQKPHPRAQ